MDCTHKFIGRADGVTCELCGLHLSRKEYLEYCKPKKTKPKTKKVVKKDE